MKIIKRSGSENEFDADKIIAAISKANTEVPTMERLSEEQIAEIASNVESICEEMHRALNVEEIQDLVEDQIMNKRAFALARKYITYRYNRALVRKSNSTDKQILSLIECDNEEVMQENSNKNPTVNSVQRDYMAGEVSKDITKRFLLPEDIVRAHEQGIIHFHDSDYFAQHMHNCCLVNLEDMLQQRHCKANDHFPYFPFCQICIPFSFIHPLIIVNNPLSIVQRSFNKMLSFALIMSSRVFSKAFHSLLNNLDVSILKFSEPYSSMRVSR